MKFLIIALFFIVLAFGIIGCTKEIIEEPIIEEPPEVSNESIAIGAELVFSIAQKMTGIAYDGRYLRTIGNVTKNIFKLEKNGTVVSNCTIPFADNPRGLTVIGSRLFFVDRGDDLLYQVDKSCNHVSNCSLLMNDAYGLDYDGRYLVTTDNLINRTYLMDKDCSVIKNVSITGVSSWRGIGFDGRYYHVLDGVANQTYLLGKDFVNISNKSAGGVEPEGIVVIGSQVWITDNKGSRIYSTDR